RIMLHVHNHGVGECGIYPFEVAETKVTRGMDTARKNQHPRQCVMEKQQEPRHALILARTRKGSAPRNEPRPPAGARVRYVGAPPSRTYRRPRYALRPAWLRR